MNRRTVGTVRPLGLARRHPLLAIVLLAAVVRGLYFLWLSAGANDPILLGNDDGRQYFNLGRHLSTELSFDANDFIFRPPGYPLLIAAELVVVPGDDPWVPIIVNMVLSVAAVPLTYLLATALGVGRRVALIAALILAVEPTSARMAVKPLSEPLLTLFFVGAVALSAAAVRTPSRAVRFAALSGLAAGLALLTHAGSVALGTVLAILLVTTLWRVLGPRAVVAGAVLVAIAIAPYFAWRSSNERNFGVATYSSLGNYALYFHRGTSVLRRVTGEPAPKIEQRLADRLSADLGAYPGSRNVRYYRYTTDRRAIERMRTLGVDIARDHPFWFVAMYPVSAAKLFFSNTGDRVPRPLSLTFLATLYVMALVGLGRLWAAGRRFAFATVFVVVAYVVLVTTTSQGSLDNRYLTPVMPLIAVAAAAAISWDRRPSDVGPEMARQRTGDAPSCKGQR
jgi:dolichyl-phosphate-mannose-protein mannosyltransferase